MKRFQRHLVLEVHFKGFDKLKGIPVFRTCEIGTVEVGLRSGRMKRSSFQIKRYLKFQKHKEVA